MDDPFHLQRFVDAQNPVIEQAMAELRAGAKRSHWMWFVFPQIAGLGHSAMARRFALAGLEEARAYRDHATLGSRLKDCTKLVLNVDERTCHQIFGSPDDLKFCSSMTLFSHVDDGGIFQQALDKYCGGSPDRATLELLFSSPGRNISSHK